MQKWPFKIEYLNQQGHGVTKIAEQLAIIPKTLVDEEGTAKVLRENKRTKFLEIDELKRQNEHRIKPQCQYYSNCYGCQLQHMNYADEIEFKKKQFSHSLNNLFQNYEIKIIKSDKHRYNYRNRVQLHYDLNCKKIGFQNPFTGLITPISNCILANENIQAAIDKFMAHDIWHEMVPPTEPQKGHIEFYDIGQKVHQTWNQPHGSKGFTQVNTLLNEEVKKILAQTHKESKFGNTLELFAGNGNLTNHLKLAKRVCVDFYNEAQGSFINLNLYDKNALDRFKFSHSSKYKTLILDPPRKGFNQLAQWAQELEPKQIIYMSCNYHSALKDIENLNGYQLKEVYLIDFFPNTHHFEALIILQRA